MQTNVKVRQHFHLCVLKIDLAKSTALRWQSPGRDRCFTNGEDMFWVGAFGTDCQSACKRYKRMVDLSIVARAQFCATPRSL